MGCCTSYVDDDDDDDLSTAFTDKSNGAYSDGGRRSDDPVLLYGE